MASFKLTVDENGNSKFLDPADKATHKSLLLAIYKSLTSQGKKAIYTITITTYEKTINEKQIALWHVLVSLISQNSGNDFNTTEQTLINNFTKLKEVPEQMSNERFQELLLFATAFANDFFNLNIETTPDGQFKIQTK